MRQVHGEFTSADASGLAEPASRFQLYKPGSATVDSLDANDEQLLITDLTLMSTAALTVSVYDGADATVDNGERIAIGLFGANGGMVQKSNVGHLCQVGKYPKVKSSGAGQIDAVLRGIIYKKNSYK